VLAAQLQIRVSLFGGVTTVHMNEPKLLVGVEMQFSAQALMYHDAISMQLGIHALDVEHQPLW
jgi:hypothetical protein